MGLTCSAPVDGLSGESCGLSPLPTCLVRNCQRSTVPQRCGLQQGRRSKSQVRRGLPLEAWAFLAPPGC